MKHPNAVIGSGSSLTGGALVLFLLSLVGIHVDNYAAAAIAAAAGGIVLWAGRQKGGLFGIWGRLMHGTPPEPPAPLKKPPAKR